jgi:UDP-glucose 4-epimerase
VVDNLYNSSVEALNRIELISGKRPSFYKADVTDPAALEDVFSKHPGISSVIHFAALKVRVGPLLNCRVHPGAAGRVCVY